MQKYLIKTADNSFNLKSNTMKKTQCKYSNFNY